MAATQTNDVTGAQQNAAEDIAAATLPNALQKTDLLAPVWRFLLHRYTLIITALICLAYLLAALMLPQIPGQLQDEPAASARWTLTTVAAYGPLGDLLRGLGLFNVMNSLLFRMALAAVSLVVAVHLADRIGAALAYWSIKKSFCAPATDETGSLQTAAPLTVFRRRFAVDSSVPYVASSLSDVMASRYDAVSDCEPPSPDPDKVDAVQRSPDVHALLDGVRYLAERNPTSFYLRPALPLGVLAAASMLWLYLLFGWEVSTPAIAPGGSYRTSTHDMLVEYQIPEQYPYQHGSASMQVIVDHTAYTSTISSGKQARAGSSPMSIRETTPGLLIRVADDRQILTQPGSAAQTDSVGLVLPSPGSEESLLIPDVSWGVRILRRADQPVTFIVELYEGAELQPQQRIEIDDQTTATIDSIRGDITLEFIPLPGVEVTVRHVPAPWLPWLAAAISLFGLYGLIRPPAIVVAGLVDWPVGRTQLTLLANRLDEVAFITAELENVAIDAALDGNAVRNAGAASSINELDRGQ